MEAVFLRQLNMSITAGWLVLAVIALRLILRKAPTALRCVMWALVGMRLVCPISVESFLSLIPSTEPIREELMYAPAPTIDSGIEFVNRTVNPIISEALSSEGATGVNPVMAITSAASCIWIVGMAAMIVYTLVSYIRIRRSVREAIELTEGIVICDRISAPFILGVFRPRIFLPSSMNETDTAYVIAHEKAHLKRRDHLWKPIGFAILTVYWFNPLIWIAYILLCRDIELACDEKVIRELGAEIKKPYSEALINCSVPRRSIAACPLAFGEVGVKGRIKSVLNYKKPAFWLIAVTLAACVAVGVCFLTDPKDSGDDTKTEFGTNSYNSICNVSCGTDSDADVKVTLKSASVRDGAPYLTLEWANGEGVSVERGTEWHIYYDEDGTWVDCDQFAEQRAWEALLLILLPGGKEEVTYYLDERDLNRAGMYRFEQEFGLENSDGKYTAYVEFELTTNAKSVMVSSDGSYGSGIWAKSASLQYFDVIEGDATCWLDDTYGLTFEMRDIIGDVIRISLNKPVFLSGTEVREFDLRPGETVKLTADTEDGGHAIYEFSITDRLIYHSDTPPDYQETEDGPMPVAGVNTDDTDELYRRALNSERCVLSSQYPARFDFPIFKFDTRDEVDGFIADFSEIALTDAYDTGASDAIPPFGVMTEEYSEDFFETHSLLAVYVDARTYSDYVASCVVEPNGTSCTVRVKVHRGETDGNVPGGFIMLVEVEKELLKDCTEFDAYPA